MNRSNVTSTSFTVQDDLISQTSATSTFMVPRAFNSKPFSKDYGPKGAMGMNAMNQLQVPSIQRKIAEQARLEAYKQLNNDLFNPFQHKLNQGFISREGDLYQRQKQRQIQMIKRKEMDQINNAKSYTIIFPQSSIQNAAKNVLNEDNAPSIGDYYNKKFKKDKLANIEEQQNDQEHVIKNNFVGSVKKSQKNIDNQPKQRSSAEIKPLPQPKTKIVKSADGWKRETDSQSMKSIQQNIVKPDFQVLKTKAPVNAILRPQKSPLPPKVQNQKSKPVQKQKQKQPISEKKNKPPAKKPTTQKKTDPKIKKYSQVYQGADRNLIEQLENQITECPTITFDDIAQLDNAKSLLQEAVLLPRMMPDFFKGIRRAMKGVLLFGPPGTGKTLLAKAVASNNMFFNVSASSLASKWKGQSQKMVRLLFQMARYYAPSVIFFDEIDCIASKRSENQHESARKVKTQLLVQMDGVGTSEKEVFVLAATNRPWDLDQALRRRLQKRIYIPLPQKQGRKQLLNINLKELKVAKEVNWEKLVELTKGCSGADICNICRDAAYMPMRRKISQVGGITKLAQISQKDLIEEEITEQDLFDAAKKTRPSVNNDDLKRYSDWMKEFGSN